MAVAAHKDHTGITLRYMSTAGKNKRTMLSPHAPMANLITNLLRARVSGALDREVSANDSTQYAQRNPYNCPHQPHVHLKPLL